MLLHLHLVLAHLLKAGKLKAAFSHSIRGLAFYVVPVVPSPPSFMDNLDSSFSSSVPLNSNPNNTDTTCVDNLQLLFENFGRMSNETSQIESNGATSSLRINRPYSNAASAPRTQQEQSSAINVNQNQESGLGIATPQSIWPDHGSSSASNSNLQERSYVLFSPPNHTNDRQCNLVMAQATTSEGSQNLQNLLSRGDPRIINQVFHGVIGSIFCLITDWHGSHVFVKLIPLCDPSQLLMITQRLSQQEGKPIIDASFNPTGSYSLQRLIRPLIRSDMAAPVVAALSSEFYRLMKDKTACKVVLKCVEHLPPKESESLYEAGIESCLELARDMWGCRSLNLFIEYVKGPLRDRLLHRISDHSVFLAQDPTANRVLQKVIDLRNPIFTEKICRLLRGEYANLSLQKAGSYVVQKCLRTSHWVLAVDDLVKSDGEQLLQIAKNQSGNYVVQEALRVSKEESPDDLHPKLLEKLGSFLTSLQSGHGKKVLLVIAELKSQDEGRNC